MVHIKKRKHNEDPQPSDYFEDGDIEAVPLVLDTVVEISSVRLNLPDDLTKQENKTLVKETMKEVLRSFSGELPMIDPIKDMQINDENLISCMEKIKKLGEKKTEIENNIGNKELIRVLNLDSKKLISLGKS